MGHGLGQSATLVADAGPARGFGHLSRSTGLAAALAANGLDVACLANGALEPIERDGFRWEPLRGRPPGDADIVVIDSYELGPEDVEPGPSLLLAMHDEGPFPEADRIVSVGSPPGTGDARVMAGLRYACLRPAYWNAPVGESRESVERVLIATGSADDGRLATALAEALSRALPGAAVGPVSVRDSLAADMEQADLIVTAAGQTMLEAAALGLPGVVIVTAENQRAQAQRLVDAGAVEMATDPIVDDVVARVERLARDAAARAAMSRAGQRTVDGDGAHRVAEAIVSALVGER